MQERRTTLQNKKMWPMLKDFAEQMDWHGQRLSDEDWKDLFSACVTGQRLVPSLSGQGFVAFGSRTKHQTKEYFSDMFELMHATAAENGVVFSDPKERALQDYPEAQRGY